MTDLFYLAAVVAFFAVMVGVVGCAGASWAATTPWMWRMGR